MIIVNLVMMGFGSNLVIKGGNVIDIIKDRNDGKVENCLSSLWNEVLNVLDKGIFGIVIMFDKEKCD